MVELFALMEAKAARDVVRDTLVKALRAGADAHEIAALLQADAIAGRELEQAIHVERVARCGFERAPNQIPDSPTQPETEPIAA